MKICKQMKKNWKCALINFSWTISTKRQIQMKMCRNEIYVENTRIQIDFKSNEILQELEVNLILEKVTNCPCVTPRYPILVMQCGRKQDSPNGQHWSISLKA